METFPRRETDGQGGMKHLKTASAAAVINKQRKTEEIQCTTPRQTKN
jgi:hypothetical protein